MSPEEHRRLRYQGRAKISQDLCNAVADGKLSEEAIESYATGMADGLREFLVAFLSERAAYEMLQQAADRATKTARPHLDAHGAPA